MSVTRRDAIRTIGAAALAAGVPASGGATIPLPIGEESSGFAAARADFPWLKRNIWLAAAETHPLNVHALRAIDRYTAYRSNGPGEGRASFSADDQAETKRLFGSVIGATPDEIAFCTGTTDGENTVVGGMDLERQGGNIVIDDLHFEASKHLYTTLAKAGRIELRTVRHRNWRVQLSDMDKAIDRNTRLVSMALVSNVNGFMHDAKAVSDLAHARGAYLYADVIQAAGAVPLDVKALGIDFCACSTYKWLMGDFGFGFLYVREDLQGTVVRPTRHGLRQMSGGNPRPGAARYEGVTTLGYLPAVCALEGLRYLTRLGIPNIRSHAKRLTDRFQQELPRLGYPSITPADSPTPIVSFLTPNVQMTEARLNEAFGEQVVSFPRRWQATDEAGKASTVTGMRIGVSVYNNEADVDRFLKALS
jgi:selenocysteine lyase/cysteine desulfurase